MGERPFTQNDGGKGKGDGGSFLFLHALRVHERDTQLRYVQGLGRMARAGGCGKGKRAVEAAVA